MGIVSIPETGNGTDWSKYTNHRQMRKQTIAGGVYATLLDVVGKGFLFYAFMYTSGGTNGQLRLTIDGAQKTLQATASNEPIGYYPNMFAGKYGADSAVFDLDGVSSSIFPKYGDESSLASKKGEVLILPIAFNSSLKIEVYHASEGDVKYGYQVGVL